MKNYFLGIIAVLTAIAFSAFTPAHQSVKRDTTPMLWYEVASNGNLVDYLNPINSTPATRSDFLLNEETCIEGDEEDCVRGFDNTVHTPTSATDRTEDDIIQKD